MLTLTEIFSKLSSEYYTWLPDYSINLNPKNKQNEYIQDTEIGYEYYCKWLTEHLTNNSFIYTAYQIEIIKKLKRNKHIGNPFWTAWAGISETDFFDRQWNGTIVNFPVNYLNNPDPKRLKTKDLTDFFSDNDMPKFRGLDHDQNIQVYLVFVFISYQQNELRKLVDGPHWNDIGWRPLLKEGLKTQTTGKDKIKFTSNFINEIAYLRSK